MPGIHNGVQAVLLRENEFAVYSPCACHTLNLCVSNTAECCPDVITYFGVVQKLFTFCSASLSDGRSFKTGLNVRYIASQELDGPSA